MSAQTQVALPPAAVVNQLVWGFATSQALYAGVKLRVFDVIQSAPKTSQQIAETVGANEPALRRLLRALTSFGVLSEDEEGRFSATETGALLSYAHPQSQAAFANMILSPFVWKPWGELYHSVLTGEPAFDQVFGEPTFNYLMKHPEEGAVFNAAMTSLNRMVLPAILNNYDFGSFSRIVDVGGGEGILLSSILEQNHRAQGVLFDLPGVAEAAKLKSWAVAERCEFGAGDMFEAVPAGGDAYILQQIVHDWDDTAVIQLLKNCRAAIKESGKLLVIELIIEPPNKPDPAKVLDLNMMVMLTGRERTETEFAELFAASGFKLTRTVPLGGPYIIEAVPV
jgi:hypothetical protein